MRDRQRATIALLAIVSLAVALRVGVALYLGNVVDAPPLLTDQRSYHALGASLIAGRGFSFPSGWYPFTPANTPTAHWSFLYSLFMAAVYSVTGVQPLAGRLVQAVLGGVLLPWMTYRFAARLLGANVSGRQDPGRQPATLPLLSAFLAAVYFYFVLYSATLMTETFYISALLWSLERGLALAGAASLRGGLWLGLSLGAATLLRQSILPWLVVLFAWLLYVGWKAGRLRRMAAGVAVAGVMVGLMILPFTLRNYRVYGQFLLLNSNAGYAMYSAQHPMHGSEFREFDAAPLPKDLAGTNEAQWDRDLMRRGIGFVLAEPGRYALLSMSRVRDYFEFWPTPDTSLLNNVGRVGSFGLFLPFMLYGIWLAVRRGRLAATEPLGLVLTFMAFYSLLHVMTWAMPRYRLPVDAVALPFAALALHDLAGRAAIRWGLKRPWVGRHVGTNSW